MSGDDGWRADLERWLAPFLNQLSHPARRAMCPLDIAGLIGPGDRKSVQPMAQRLGMSSHDRLHHFVSAGFWDAAPLQADLVAQANRLVGGPDASLVIDDTALSGADELRVIRCRRPSNHLFSEYFKELTKTDIVHVPYKGSAPAMTDLLGGRVQMMFDTIPVLLPHIKNGQLRALGVAMESRSPLAPELATLTEAGVPDLVGGTWFGVFGPPGMADERVAYVNKIVTDALASPDIQKVFIQRGTIPSSTTPQGLASFVMDEIRRWSEIAQRPTFQSSEFSKHH